MSELLSVPSFGNFLRGWYKAPDAMLTGTSSWKDSSGNGFNITNTTPIPLTSPSNGLPYWACDGSTTKMVSTVQLQSLLAAGAKTVFCSFYAHAITGTQTNYYNNESLFGTSGGFVGLCLRNNSGAYELASYMNGTGFGGSADFAVQTGLTLDAWHIGIYAQNAGTLYCFLDDPIVSVTHATGTQTAAGWTTANLQLGINLGSTLFLNGRIGELLFFNSFLSDNDRATVFNYMGSRWPVRPGDPLEQMRDTASRRSWMLGRPRMHIALNDIPLATSLPATVLDDTQESFVSHPRGLSADGTGWGEKFDWQPRPGRVEEFTLNFDKCTRTLKLADLRRFRHTLIDSGKVTFYGPRREGALSGGAGVLRVFTRDSLGYFLDPGDGYTIIRAGVDREQQSTSGIVLGPATTQYLLRNSFITGSPPTGWTLTLGTGGAIIASVSEEIFESTISTQSLKVTYGTALDCYATSTAAAGSYTGTTGLSLMHSKTSGYARVAIQRSVDSQWLKSDLSGWAAAVAWIDPTAVTQYGTPIAPIAKLSTFAFDVGATPTSLTLRLGLPAGTPAATFEYFYHAEICNGVTPPPNLGLFQVTDASAVASAADQILYKVLQATGPVGPGSPADWQTIAFKLQAPAGVGPLYIGFVGPTLTEGWYVAWNGSALTFNAWHSSTISTATGPSVSWDPTHVYRVVVRRISSHGDLGLAAKTLSIFVDGVKGTDAAETATPAPVDYQIASLIGGSASGAVVSSLVFSPYASTDQECATWGL
jgi:hypothetical protein